jgi:uncharacterized membrane protein
MQKYCTIFNSLNLTYLLWLFLPVIWGIRLKYLTFLVPAIPALAINLLATSPTQKGLTHQYSLPILPFLFLLVIATVASEKTWSKSDRNIILWCLVAFLALAKFGYFGSIYLDTLDTWQASREAIAQIPSNGNVLTTTDYAPHLTHRQAVAIADIESQSSDLRQFNYILLNKRHPGWASSPEIANNLINKLQRSRDFQLAYNEDDVFLFVKDFS